MQYLAGDEAHRLVVANVWEMAANDAQSILTYKRFQPASWLHGPRTLPVQKGLDLAWQMNTHIADGFTCHIQWKNCWQTTSSECELTRVHKSEEGHYNKQPNAMAALICHSTLTTDVRECMIENVISKHLCVTNHCLTHILESWPLAADECHIAFNLKVAN